jgi:hypothetical protein
MLRGSLSFCLLVVLLCSSPALAAPNLINYQGLLTDATGVAITNANQSLTFRLFDAETTGNLLWEEVRSVNVQNGSYNLLLGSVAVLDPALLAGDSVWLEVVVDTEVLGGRQRLVSVPYAMQAATAQTALSVADGAGSGLDADLLDGQQGSFYLDWANLANVPADIADGDQNTNTTYTSGNGLNLQGTTFAVNVPLSLLGSSPWPIIRGVNSLDSGIGVQGESSAITGIGVQGRATLIGPGQSRGGWFTADSDNGVGVSGHANTFGPISNIGVEGRAQGDYGKAVYAIATGSSGTGVFSTAKAYGGSFSASNDTGRGVFGISTGASGYGVYGRSDGASGYGLYGENTAGGYAGYFQGNVHLTGVLSGDGTGLTTDWANLTNIPAYIADGDQDTTYSSGSGLNLVGSTFSLNVPLILSGSSESSIIYATNSDGNAGRGLSAFAWGSSGVGVSGHALATGPVSNRGGWFSADGDNGIGVYGEANALGAFGNTGGSFRAQGDYSQGVYGYSSGINGTGVSGSAKEYGGRFSSDNATGYGVWAKNTGDSGYGVYGWSEGAGGYGIYGVNTAGGYAGYFQGNVHLTGVLSGDGSGLTNLPGGPGSGLDADLLDGQQGSFYLDWTNLTNVPVGIADGDQNTTYTNGVGLDLVDTTFSLKFPLSLNGASPVGAFNGTNTDAAGSGFIGTASATGTATNYGMKGIAFGDSGRGVYGRAYATGPVMNFGGYFHASGDSGRGIYGSTSGVSGYGVSGVATASVSATNYGGHFISFGDSGYGVYGESQGSSGYGVYGRNSFGGYAGYFNGKVHINGVLSGDGSGLTNLNWSSLSSVPAGFADGVDDDTDTTYVAGSGLALNGTTFSVDSAVLQSRVTGTCAVNSSIRAIASNGAVTCEADTDTNTTYTAGSGLSLVGTTFSVATGAITQTHIAIDGVGAAEIANNAVSTGEIVDNGVRRADINGIEVPLYTNLSICTNGSAITTSSTCSTLLCGPSLYLNCSSQCISGAPVSCSNTLLGYLVSPSAL